MHEELKQIKPKEYLESIISPLLQYPNELVVTEKQDERGILLTMSCAKEDMGRVIGKSGTTAQAIRTVLRQFGGTVKSFVSLKIEEPQENLNA